MMEQPVQAIKTGRPHPVILGQGRVAAANPRTLCGMLDPIAPPRVSS